MKGIIGKKIGMTQIFDENGNIVPVTVIKGGPCVVIQCKEEEKDGYYAVQLGFEEMKIKEKTVKVAGKKVKRVVKPTLPKLGHFKKYGVKPVRYIKEFRLSKKEDLKPAQIIDVSVFEVGDIVDIIGISKGKGFSGVMRRHGFSGNRASHGVKTHREPGAIGSSAYPSRVFKGKKLPGRYGNKRCTIKNLKIVKVDPENHLLLIKGGIPGSRKGIVYIKSSDIKV